MSIIVKGVEIPTQGWKCPLNSYGVCKLKSLSCGKYIPTLCPLSSLPKRHGRLIEAERLREEFPYPSEGMGGWRNPDEALVHKTGVWAAIDCAETIVEAEGDD